MSSQGELPPRHSLPGPGISSAPAQSLPSSCENPHALFVQRANFLRTTDPSCHLLRHAPWESGDPSLLGALLWTGWNSDSRLPPVSAEPPTNWSRSPGARVKPAPERRDKLRTEFRKGPHRGSSSRVATGRSLNSPAFSRDPRARPVPPSRKVTGWSLPFGCPQRASPKESPNLKRFKWGTSPSSPSGAPAASRTTEWN